MALNATIYKFNVALSDMNRNLFESFLLTVAQHPSETLERMMVRVMVYCCHYSSHLEFTKGLSTPETPDIWLKTLDGQTAQWLEVGEPAADKIKKATRVAQNVVVYSFNSKSSVWWGQEQSNFADLRVNVMQFQWPSVAALAKLVSRTMTIAVTISESSIYITTDDATAELDWTVLQTAS